MSNQQYDIAIDLHSVAYGLEMTVLQSKAIKEDNDGRSAWCEIVEQVPKNFSNGYQSLQCLYTEIYPHVGSLGSETVKNVVVLRRADIGNLKQLLSYFVSRSCLQALENFEVLTTNPHPHHKRYQSDSSQLVPAQDQKAFVIWTPKEKTIVRSLARALEAS